jgi:hypothetical protein
LAVILAGVATTTIAQSPEAAEAKAAEPGITVEAVIVEPEKPAEDTLCKLRVRLQNHGDQMASQLGFQVTINDQQIPVYVNQLFMFPLAAGSTSEVPLFNFWSTESSRRMPKDGRLKVEVGLLEAKWTKVEEIEEVETWTETGEVPGLPVAKSITLEMTR